MRDIKKIIENEVYIKINELIESVRETEEYEEERENRIDWEEIRMEIEVVTGRGNIETLEKEELEELAKEEGIDIYGYKYEPIEYYAVSGWLVEILRELEYPVSYYRGIHVMERITTGQPLECDYIMKQVQEREGKNLAQNR